MSKLTISVDGMRAEESKSAAANTTRQPEPYTPPPAIKVQFVETDIAAKNDDCPIRILEEEKKRRLSQSTIANFGMSNAPSGSKLM